MKNAPMGVALLLLAVALGAPAASANDNAAHTPVNHFSIRVKMIANGRTKLVKVGDVKRGADGKATATGVAAPVLDRMGTDLLRRWKRFRRPSSVAISDEFYSDSGMRPSKDRYTFTFKPSDPLFSAAVARKFIEDNGYETLGLSTIDFIEYDTQKSKAKPGKRIYDEALAKYNFRKGKTLRYNRGRYDIVVYKNVRPANNGRPMSVLRVSASRPTLALAQNHDDGNWEIGRITLHKDGRITVAAKTAAEVFENSFGAFNRLGRGVEVSVIENASTWKTLKVAKDSPMLFEAYVVDLLEAHRFYDVTPKLDPVIFE